MMRYNKSLPKILLSSTCCIYFLHREKEGNVWFSCCGTVLYSSSWPHGRCLYAKACKAEPALNSKQVSSTAPHQIHTHAGGKALSCVTCVRACVVWGPFTCDSLVHTHVCRVCELNQSPSRFIITLTTLRAGSRDRPDGKVKISITFTMIILTVTGQQWLGFLYKCQC